MTLFGCYLFSVLCLAWFIGYIVVSDLNDIGGIVLLYMLHVNSIGICVIFVFVVTITYFGNCI